MRVRQACTCAGGLADGGLADGGLADGGCVFVMSNFATEHDIMKLLTLFHFESTAQSNYINISNF